MPQPIREDSTVIDLHHRFQQTTTVAASPSGATETTIATLTLTDFGDIQIVSGIQLVGWAAYTVGTSGVSVNLQIKQTNSSGTAVSATGATTATAANLGALEVRGFDSGAGVGVYVLTMTVASGAATSTVSKVYLGAVLI